MVAFLDEWDEEVLEQEIDEAFDWLERGEIPQSEGLTRTYVFMTDGGNAIELPSDPWLWDDVIYYALVDEYHDARRLADPDYYDDIDDEDDDYDPILDEDPESRFGL